MSFQFISKSISWSNIVSKFSLQLCLTISLKRNECIIFHPNAKGKRFLQNQIANDDLAEEVPEHVNLPLSFGHNWPSSLKRSSTL